MQSGHDPGVPLTPSPGGLVSGFGLVFEGYRMLRAERSLWALAIVPLGFSVLAAGIASVLVYVYAGELYGVVWSVLPVLDVSAWYQWLWLGPAKLVIAVLSWLIFAVAAALALLLGLLLANLAAAPFLDALSARVERLASGELFESGSGGLRDMLGDVGRSLSGELQRTLFFVSIWALLLGVGFVIPGAQLVTGPLSLAVTIVFLPLEFSGYVLDRRRVRFGDRRRWILREWPRMAGFGSAAFLACFVPLLNLAVMPVLVVAGTLLAVRCPPSTTTR